jgi:hypothetical protein
MINDADHYEAYYADKLWSLLPAVYRAQDTDQYSSNGPLREMVNRIGVQAAILRRSIDRTWEDQSIETCDDWVIPYIGDLLVTNLVANLDARGQRQDVANTIYYRRRKGTVAILEEIAVDITGWEAKIVEFFRRLGRTRHGLDPEIGVPLSPTGDVATLQVAEGLAGPITRTPIGGTADLRKVYGAGKSRSAFDEYFHTADYRLGRGQVGWHNIPRLGVFLWRLRSYGLSPTTPVPVTGCAEWFTFDPTGRDIPLFAQDSRTAENYYANWASPVEAQLPAPISQTLFDTNEALLPGDLTVRLYGNSMPANSLCVLTSSNASANAIDSSQLTIRPARGRFKYKGQLAVPNFWAKYFYGFSSEIGAGPYDRRAVLGPESASASLVNAPSATTLAVPAAGTLMLDNSMTYNGASDVAVSGQLTIRAANLERPLIRLAAPASGQTTVWTLTGAKGSCLGLDGLFISGGDLVLAGEFSGVTITCCTLDPGDAAQGSFATSADGRQLVPTRLRIQASIGSLTIARSITGPILSEGPGEAETVAISESILQALPNSTPHPVVPEPPPDAPPGVVKMLPTNIALSVADAEVSLSRCTVMGAVIAHWLQASECILREIATVDDIQQGCVRFTAWASGSVLPRKYESVQIPAGAPLFTSTIFGQPGYAQLLPSADSAIIPASDPSAGPPNTISAGAEDGSEMGAFAREMNPVKERSLLIKYEEFMPASLVPVLVYVT